ncbi:Leucine-rich repeat protein kinase family protein [Euphorbia peplus]|nr:Leucine-rich repeat protein kinase family protein [Euphorbia peplus]
MKEGVVEVKDATEVVKQRKPALRGAKRGGILSSYLEFNLAELLNASAELLPKGVLGTSYKAVLEWGTIVVVKRITYFDLSDKEFEEMIQAIEKMNHDNLLPLLASFFSNDEKFLVQAYMSMGNLSALLHGNKGASKTPLNWDTRIGIALGVARAIEHIHSQGPLTSHGNIKSSNVLLTKTLEVRVSDYGLAGFSPTANCTNGYSAPDVNKVSQKADVYSYGVMFLELLTRKDPEESYLKDEEIDLPRWLLSAADDEWTSEVFDFDLFQYGISEEVMLQTLGLAFSCTSHNPESRPSMTEVVSQIEMLCCFSSQADQTHVDVEENNPNEDLVLYNSSYNRFKPYSAS